MSIFNNHKFTASLGSIVEWYDFCLYGYFAKVFSRLFFPVHYHSSLIWIFLIFSSGLIARVLGGFFFGLWGDARGKKRALNASIALITLTTMAMGLLPTYHQVGFSAVFLLLLLRVLQGLSAGGQYSGAITTLVLSDRSSAARSCAYAFIASLVGFLLANGVCQWVVTFYPDDHAGLMFWRIPFLFSGVFLPVAFYLMRFPGEQVKQVSVNEVLRDLLVLHKRPLILAMLFSAVGAIFYYTTYIYLFTYMQEVWTGPKIVLLKINAISLLFSGITIVLFAHFSDHWGRLKMLLLSLSLMIIFVYPALWLVQSNRFMLMTVGNVMLMSAANMAMTTLAPLYSELFPEQVCYTGCALAYNGGIALFGSATPVFLAYCSSSFQGSAWGMLLLLVANSFFGMLLVLYCIKREVRRFGVT